VFQANTCQQETAIFFTARDLSRTEELALLVPQVMLPLLPNLTVVKRVGRPLAGPRVQNGLFPSGKAAAINSHPAPTLPVGCSA
jgi:hypothetical protein